MSHPIDRRRFIGGIGAIAGGLLVGNGLSGCASSPATGSSSGATATTAKLTMPTYVRYAGVKPDLPGTEAGVPDGFLKFPASPVASTSAKPAGGGVITAMTELADAAPPALGQNKFWQGLNEQLGCDFQLNMVPYNSWNDKFAAIVAGGDIPDIVQVRAETTPRVGDLLASKFQDLTDVLSGDGVKKYPNLANLPEYSWLNSVFNNRIYGVPRPAFWRARSIVFSRQDLLDARGLSNDVHSAAEFTALCKELTDAKKNLYSCSSPSAMMDFAAEMTGAPNMWRVDASGKFTCQVETDEFKKAIDYVAGMWKSGLFHPDSFASSADDFLWFGNGTTRLINTGSTQIDYFYDTYAKKTPGFDLRIVRAPKFDGGGYGLKYLSSGTYRISAIKKSAPERVDELLRVLDWLSAPFGTKEYLFSNYGVEGTDYTMSAGLPKLTDQGGVEVSRMPLIYIACPPAILFNAGDPTRIQWQYDYNKAVIPESQPNPTVGLASDTKISIGSKIQGALDDLRDEIIQGRQPLSAWDDAVTQWRQNGGDKIRAEYEASYAAAHA